MEGRVPPPSASDDNFLSPAGHETYVIQIPKDQIYRVPPPENALLADRFRYPETNHNHNNNNHHNNNTNNNNNNNNTISTNNNKKTALKNSCWPCLCRPCTWLCMGITVLVLTLILAMVVSWVYVFLSPKSPSFYVTGFVVVSSKGNPNKSSPKSYMVSLEVSNGNPRTGIHYEKGGLVTLIWHKRSVGECEFPTLYQQEKDSTDIQLAIHGTTATSMSATTNSTVSSEIMALEMEIPVSMNLWFVKIWRNEILVDCIFAVEPLKKNGASSNVLSQECETKFKP